MVNIICPHVIKQNSFEKCESTEISKELRSSYSHETELQAIFLVFESENLSEGSDLKTLDQKWGFKGDSHIGKLAKICLECQRDYFKEKSKSYSLFISVLVITASIIFTRVYIYLICGDK